MDILNIVGVERAENRVELSGAGERALQKNDGAEREAGERGAESGGYRNRLERRWRCAHML